MSLDVKVLYFSGCPSWQTAVERIHAASTQTGLPVEVSIQPVETIEDAARLGFTGSPTILLNGVDPFTPGKSTALACRVYTTPDGLAGSPALDQIVDALTQLPA